MRSRGSELSRHEGLVPPMLAMTVEARSIDGTDLGSTRYWLLPVGRWWAPLSTRQ